MSDIVTVDVTEAIDRLRIERDQLLDELSPATGGLAWCLEHSAVIDRVVQTLFASLRQTYPKMPRIAVIATGGYGRREMAPHSDIDITVVPEEEESPDLDAPLRSLFRALHNVLGATFRFEIGYAYRLIADVPGLDPTTRTGLLDARLVAGSQRVFASLMEAFWNSLPNGEFVLNKITERIEANRKTNDTPLVIEPHLKEGAGGLRSFQCANWIRAAIGERSARSTSAYDDLLKVRNLLHKVADRSQDLLTRVRQDQLSEAFGWPVDDMMRTVSEALLTGDEEYRETVERLHEARYRLSESVMAIRGEARILNPADAGLAAVGIAIATKLGLSVNRFASSFTDSVSGPAALYACSSGEATVRNLDRSGVLTQLLPELDACRTLLPGDSTHTYTVFEHTLQVVRHLDRASDIPFLRDLHDSVSDVEPLYLAALLHDVGKLPTSMGGRPHSQEGATIAENVCRRWGLAPGVSDTIRWLVQEHLTMSLTMRMRDIQNPATASEFAAIVGTPDRMNMLALLTWADISSVAEGAFTTAQEAFMRELIARTMEAFGTDQQVAPEPGAARRRLLRQLSKEDVPGENIDAFLNSLPAYYVTSTPSDIVRLHMDYASKAADGSPTVEAYTRSELGSTELTVCALDTPGLLSQILGVIYAYDLSILEIRACTTASQKPVAIDVFTVQFNGRPVPSGTSRYVLGALRDVLEGKLGVADVLTARGKDPDRTQKVFKYTFLDGDPAIVEVQAPRGRGMAYRLSRVLADHSLNIVSARVGQWAGNAAAAFYVQQPTNGASLRDRVAAAFSEAKA